MNILQHSFDGKQVFTVHLRGRPAWLARQVGQAIGYSHRGKRFAANIQGDWKPEFIQGHDFAIVRGAELADLKQQIFRRTGTVPLGNNRSLVVLFESGLHLALVKTQQPAGRKLRRYLVDKVLPVLARSSTLPPSVSPAPEQSLAHRREARLLRQLVLDEHRERRLSNTPTHHVPTSIKDWMSPTELAKSLGTTPYRIGCVLTQLNLRGELPGLARAYPWRDKTGHFRTCYAYSPRVRQMLQAVLAADVEVSHG